jgi:glycosyltransferase involved in cell wall biosynthesis
LIPVFNHALTLESVIDGAKRSFPVIVVNDGSTDATAQVLAAMSGITIVTLDRNQGKGAALRAGFARAIELDFTHAITLDADGQHPVAALSAFAEQCRARPEALIVGVRNLKQAGAPLIRRIPNALSNFWFRFETGIRLPDTQCGYRVYPLGAIRQLNVEANRYAFELEVMVKAAWSGIQLVPQSVQADYAAPTSQLSHFDPWRDLLRITLVHFRLSAKAVFALGSARVNRAHRA